MLAGVGKTFLYAKRHPELTKAVLTARTEGRREDSVAAGASPDVTIGPLPPRRRHPNRGAPNRFNYRSADTQFRRLQEGLVGVCSLKQAHYVGRPGTTT